MALIQPQQIEIIINIPDLVINDTIIKRKAQKIALNYNQRNKFVAVSWVVKHYSNDNGGYGEYLGQTIPDKLKETIADNNVIVRADNGDIIEDITLYQETVMVNGKLITPSPYNQVIGQELITPDPYLDENGNEITPEPYYQDITETIIPESYYEQIPTTEWTIDVMGQYDFFNIVGEYVPVKIHDMIRNYGLKADWSPNSLK